MIFGTVGAVGQIVRTRAVVFSLALIVMVSMTVISTFGQVFEAPHGAIPLAWALGLSLVFYASPVVGRRARGGVSAS